MAYTDNAKHLRILDNGALASFDSLEDAVADAQFMISSPELEAARAWIVPVTEIIEVA